MFGAHWFWACAAGGQSGTSLDLQQNSYTVIWQASSQCSSVLRIERASDWHAEWSLSAGQLLFRGPSLRPGTADRPYAVLTALQRMMAFLQTNCLAGEPPSFKPSQHCLTCHLLRISHLLCADGEPLTEE